MREIFGIVSPEKKAKIAALRETLNEDKKRVADEFNYYKSVAKDILKAKKKLESAERAYERKESERTASKLDDAKDELAATVTVFNESEAQIKLLLENVRDGYASIARQYTGRKADGVMDTFEKYNSAVMARVIEVQSEAETDNYLDTNPEDVVPMPTPDIPAITNNEPTPEEPRSEAQPAPAAYPYPPQYPQMGAPAYYMPAQQGAPAVAPVSIDVSPMLERALEATLEKFVMAFDKKIEAALAEKSVAIPASAVSVSAGSDEVRALEALILNDEESIVEKLGKMIEDLKALSLAMNELGTICADIAVKQSTANEMQKQTNDMQRQTLREQKGIQVGQRVVIQDLTAVTGEQTALQEQQKAILEEQKALSENQQDIESARRLVIENQAAIDEAIKATVAAQKEVLSAQQTIQANSAKSLDIQNDVAEKQNATLALQKEALSAQRQLFRDQKSALDKQKTLGDNKKRAKADDADTSAEDNA